MNLLNDVLTYIRRIIKSPSNAQITDDLLIDYVNRFWIMDIDARMQVFDLKTTYQFETVPGVDQYNMPLYDIQIVPETQAGSGSQSINFYPVYQGFLGPAYVNGVQVSFQTQRGPFFNAYPNIVQNLQAVAVGNGGATYTFQLPILSNFPPLNPPLQGILRGHVDLAGIIATGVNNDPPLVSALDISTPTNFIQKIPVTSVHPALYITSIAADGSSMVVSDSGQFLASNQNYGLLMYPGKAPLGNLPISTAPNSYSTTLNTVNYFTGEINVTFQQNVPPGQNINVQCFYFQTGLPRSILYYNNTLTFRAPPDRQYLVELEAYLTPAAFLKSEQAVPFAYMSEYIARGAARKLLSDTGDVEQFQFYEPLFREQELLVWKRSQRQWTATRTETLYSQGMGIGQYGNNNLGGGTI